MSSTIKKTLNIPLNTINYIYETTNLFNLIEKNKINLAFLNSKVGKSIQYITSIIINILFIGVFTLVINNYLEDRKTFLSSWNINYFREFISKDSNSNLKEFIQLNILQNTNNHLNLINYDTLEMKIIQSFYIENNFFINNSNDEFVSKINKVLNENNFPKLNDKQEIDLKKSFHKFKYNNYKSIPFIY
jgi:hypothetical protein